ncbi:LysR family transcriptional regulator [Portibacter lacus]|uniref:LysR family transcriptional regulator n=1 Tax=Portibacter lacus TaxID=1099794 RepID=A0AA37SW16_9BACT|nr:LysR family transcriptional regulator [Portibacter lacus]GLR19098.1 LysR family transcriptional regulator [Portibacter lacus]
MCYQLELRHLRYFLAVAEDLHFRKAAERLFISQPGLSKQIKEMEVGMGVKLFDRHNRKVELTQAGEFLKVELKNYFSGLEHIIEHAKLLNDGLLGDLKIGYVGSAMQKIIPDLLLAFRKHHPKVLFNLEEIDNQGQIDRLFSHDIDIGFVRLEKIPRGLKSIPVLNETFSLVLPKDHPINDENFVNLAQLKDASFILFNEKYSPSYFENVMQIFEDNHFTPNVTHNTIHASSIYKLVENNFGLSIVPQSLKPSFVEGVKFIDLENIPQRTVLSAVWNLNNRNPILKNFLEKIESHKDKN